MNDITQVKVGDAANVVPDGSLERIPGRVVFVGSPSTAGSSTTYPVVIGLNQTAAALRNGRREGCHLSLNTVDLGRIRAAAPDEVIRCEECRRILVREQNA